LSDRLYINGKLADLKDVVISETKQINNFFDVRDRQTSFTNKFILPFTPINKEIYDMLGVVGVNSNAPYRIGTATFIRGGIPTITNGRITVSKYEIGKGYSTSIQYGNIDIFDVIGKEKVSDLDYIDINHSITTLNFIDSFSNNYNDGYIYAIADFGVLDVADIDIQYQTPSVFRRWIWDKIFNEAGFTYEYIGNDNVFESNLFINSLISLNEGTVVEDDIQNPLPELKVELNSFSDYSEFESVPDDITIIDFDINVSESLDVDDIFDIINNKGVLKVKKSGYYTFSGDGDFFSQSFKSVVIQKNNINNSYLSVNTIGDVVLAYSKKIYLTPSDEVKIIVRGNQSEFTYNLSFSITKDNEGGEINFSDFFDNISKKDFIKGVIQDYGLLMRRNGTTYKFIQIEEMFNDFDNAEDWSNLFDKQLKEVYKIGNYTKENKIKYKYDADENYSDGSFNLDNETLKEENLLFSSKFRAPKITSETIGGEVIYSAPIFTLTLNDDGSVKEVKKKKGASFIFNNSKVNSTINFNLKGLDNDIFTGSIPVANFNELDYNQIISKRYNLFSVNINKPIKTDVTFAMTALHVYELDFFKLKYIKQLASYYYVNKIIGFKNSKKTKVELIRVLSNIKSFGEYNDDYNNDYNI